MSSRRDENPPEALRADTFGSLFGSLFQYCKQIRKKHLQVKKVLKRGEAFRQRKVQKIIQIAPRRHLGIHGVILAASGCSKTPKWPPKWSPGHLKSTKNAKNYPPETHTETGLKKKNAIAPHVFNMILCKICRQSTSLMNDGFIYVWMPIIDKKYKKLSPRRHTHTDGSEQKNAVVSRVVYMILR